MNHFSPLLWSSTYRSFIHERAQTLSLLPFSGRRCLTTRSFMCEKVELARDSEEIWVEKNASRRLRHSRHFSLKSLKSKCEVREKSLSWDWGDWFAAKPCMVIEKECKWTWGWRHGFLWGRTTTALRRLIFASKNFVKTQKLMQI